MTTPPNQRLKEDIDNSISNGISAEDFHNSLHRIIEDIFGLNDVQEMVTTSAYLSYRISAELMRSSNQAQQRDYAEVSETILRVAYNNADIFTTLSNMPLIDGLSILSNFYTFHARLMANGRSPANPYSNPNAPLNYLREIVQSSFGPWNAFINVHGATTSDPCIRVSEHGGFWICRRNRFQVENARWRIVVGGFNLSNVPSGSTQTLECATWNMQGGSASTESKWRVSVLALARRTDIVCLQEFGQPPDSATLTRELYVIDQFGQSYTMQEYLWNAGTSTRPENYSVFFFNVERIRVNLAFVMEANVFTIRNAMVVADGMSGVPRPAVGLRIAGAYADGRTDYTIFTFHAISGGGVNCPRMIREITRHVMTPFAVLGDFNRDPRAPDPAFPNRRGPWISPPRIAEIVPANGGTHGNAMLDYAVTNGTVGENQPGRVENTQMPSDHSAVLMTFTFMK